MGTLLLACRVSGSALRHGYYCDTELRLSLGLLRGADRVDFLAGEVENLSQRLPPQEFSRFKAPYLWLEFGGLSFLRLPSAQCKGVVAHALQPGQTFLGDRNLGIDHAHHIGTGAFTVDGAAPLFLLLDPR